MRYVSMAYMDTDGNLVLAGAKGEHDLFSPAFFKDAKTELDCMEFKAIIALEHELKGSQPPATVVSAEMWGDICILKTEQDV